MKRTPRRLAYVCLVVSLLMFISSGAFANTFRFGVINEFPHKPNHVIKQYNLFHTYLKQQLATQNVQVSELVIANSIGELTLLINQGKVDGFLEGLMPVIEIQKTAPVDVGLLTWRKQQREYYSVFFVRKDSDIVNLSGLTGKTIVFESHRSTSAFIVPKLTLQSLGYSLKKLREPSTLSATNVESDLHINYLFSGSEDNQAYWVHKNIGDIGAFNNGDWERVPQVIRKDLRIIGQSKPILRWLFAYHKAVPEPVRKIVNTVLLKMHESSEGVKALNQAEKILKFEQLNASDKENFSYWQTRSSAANND